MATIPVRSAPRRRASLTVLLDGVADRIDAARGGVTAGATDLAWIGLHAVGAHRWRESFETNLERGWRQFRGSRCAICDAPWEGW
jgi:hypothetical protein